MNVDRIDHDTRAALRRRLRRIEGQIRGLERSLEQERDCREVLSQFVAASSALRAAGMVLAVSAYETCLDDGDEAATEVLRETLIKMA